MQISSSRCPDPPEVGGDGGQYTTEGGGRGGDQGKHGVGFGGYDDPLGDLHTGRYGGDYAGGGGGGYYGGGSAYAEKCGGGGSSYLGSMEDPQNNRRFPQFREPEVTEDRLRALRDRSSHQEKPRPRPGVPRGV